MVRKNYSFLIITMFFFLLNSVYVNNVKAQEKSETISAIGFSDEKDCIEKEVFFPGVYPELIKNNSKNEFEKLPQLNQLNERTGLFFGVMFIIFVMLYCFFTKICEKGLEVDE